ncbi:MAG: phage protease, partial [Magnetococcales bacterium]|nr:phage protease [Magnetococcales bacterium]
MNTTRPIASCTSDLPPDSGTEIRLFPAGSFAAVDGRPGNTDPSTIDHWVMDEAAAGEVIEAFRATPRKLVIDYEHQTAHAEKNGMPAPAAGWITGLEWRPEQGLMAKVQWTDRAAAMIRAGEYQHISPVFLYDQKTGRVRRLLHAGLTNNPALPELGVVTARAITTEIEERPLSYTKIAEALGLPPEADEQTIMNHIAASKKPEPVKATAEAAPEAVRPDPVTTETIRAMQAEIAALKSQAVETELEGLMMQGVQDGRIPKSMEAWARSVGASSIEALKNYLASAQPIVALSGQQTGGREPAGLSGAPALSADELAVCTATG